MKKIWFLLSLAILFSLSTSLSAKPADQQKMAAEVNRLVEASKKLMMFYPWSDPLPETDRVAKYGKDIAPMLVDLIPDDIDSVEIGDLGAPQQAELALCKIYFKNDLPNCFSNHAYGVRSLPETNAKMKEFWLSEIKNPSN